MLLLIHGGSMENNYDREKLRQIYTDYKKLIYYAAFEILKDSHKAEEIVQETILKLTKYLDRLDLDNKKRTASYIYSVARTLSLEYIRRENHISYEDLDILGTEHADYDTYDFGEGNEIEKIILKLPPNYSEILILKYLHDMSNRDISDLLGITESNVRKRIERAKSALEKLLEKEGVKYE